MGRRPKNPASDDSFAELEKVNPKAAYMKQKCSTIGKNIREHRRQRRFSVENLAEYLELSESYIGQLERGDRCPSLKIVYKLCDLYGITTNDLLMPVPDASKGDLNVAEDRAAYNAKVQTDAIVSLLRTLSENEMEFVIETIKNVRKYSK